MINENNANMKPESNSINNTNKPADAVSNVDNSDSIQGHTDGKSNDGRYISIKIPSLRKIVVSVLLILLSYCIACINIPVFSTNAASYDCNGNSCTRNIVSKKVDYCIRGLRIRECDSTFMPNVDNPYVNNAYKGGIEQ